MQTQATESNSGWENWTQTLEFRQKDVQFNLTTEMRVYTGFAAGIQSLRGCRSVTIPTHRYWLSPDPTGVCLVVVRMPVSRKPDRCLWIFKAHFDYIRGGLYGPLLTCLDLESDMAILSRRPQ